MLPANVGLDAFTKQTRDLKPAVAKTINAVLARQRGTPGFPVRETPTLAAQEGKENDVSRVNVIAPPQEFGQGLGYAVVGMGRHSFLRLTNSTS